MSWKSVVGHAKNVLIVPTVVCDHSIAEDYRTKDTRFLLFFSKQTNKAPTTRSSYTSVLAYCVVGFLASRNPPQHHWSVLEFVRANSKSSERVLFSFDSIRPLNVSFFQVYFLVVSFYVSLFQIFFV